MATFYLDFENGNDSNDGTTFANRWKTITSGATAGRVAAGDTIRIMKSPDPVSLGVSGTFTKQSASVTLSTAVTLNIDLCESAWSANCGNATTSATRKQGTLSTSIQTTSGCAAQVQAYKTLASPLDLSAYQNVSFWIRSTVAFSSGSVQLRLCSDNFGQTAVHTINIETFVANTWKPVTFKNGAPLSTNIRSLGLYTTGGSATILLDNIIACNDLHFNALIGTSSSATNLIWYPIKSINDTTVVIDNQLESSATVAARGWHDETITTTAYARDSIKITASQTLNSSGTAAARITFIGGWDRDTMSTCNGQTFLSLTNTIQTVILGTRSYVSFENISLLWGSLLFSNAYSPLKNISWHATTGSSVLNDIYCENFNIISNVNGLGITGVLKNLKCYSNGAAGCTGQASFITRVVDGVFNNNNGNGVSISGIMELINCNAINNQLYGFELTAGRYAKITKISASNNGSGDWINNGGIAYMHNTGALNYSQITPRIMCYTYASSALGFNGYISVNGQVSVCNINTPVHGSSTTSWRHIPISDQTTFIPLIQPLQPFAVAASSLVTFKIWVYRTSTNVEARVRLRGYVTPGVDADVTATITAAINTWQELTVTCTPSAAGVVQIDLESYSVNGSTGTVYFGDATVSQA